MNRYYLLANQSYLCGNSKTFLKFFSVILLLCLIASQTFSNFFIIADYYLNRSYISTNLCENKSKPAMHCKGKCFLMKQLQEQQRKEQAPQSKKAKIENVVFLVTVQSFIFWNQSNEIHFDFYTLLKPYSFKSSIFHPPCI